MSPTAAQSGSRAGRNLNGIFLSIGWSVYEIEQMLAFLDRKEK